MSKEIKERYYMDSGYFGNLEPNLQWYFSDVLPGGTFRVSRGPGRGHRPLEQGCGKGNEPWAECTWYPDLVSAAHSAQSFILITFWHHIITPHITSHHRKRRKIRGGGNFKKPSGHDGDMESLERRKMIFIELGIISSSISEIIFIEHLASLSIDKHDKTLSLNKLFWDKKLLGNIVQAPSALLVHSLFIFVRNCKSGTVRGEHMYSRQKVHSLKSQGCLQTSIYYLFLLQFPALWSPVMTGRFCLDYGG